MGTQTAPRRGPVDPSMPRGYDPAYKTIGAVVPSERERAARQAEIYSANQVKEVEASSHLYEVLTWNPRTNVALIRRQGNPKPNAVNMTDFTCDCFQRDAVRRMNERLKASGLQPSIVCKHPRIVAERLLTDPEWLERVADKPCDDITNEYEDPQ